MENFKFLRRFKYHKYFPNYCSLFNFELPSWEDAICNINYCVLNNHPILELENFGFSTKQGKEIIQSNKIIDIIFDHNRTLEKKNFTSHLYVSLTEISKSHGKHADLSDVWIVQCVGKTKIIVYEDNSEFLYNLNPLDILYIPRGIYHEANPISPRMLLSIGYHGKL